MKKLFTEEVYRRTSSIVPLIGLIILSRYQMGADIEDSVMDMFGKKGDALAMEIEKNEAFPRRGRKLVFSEYKSRDVLISCVEFNSL